MGPSINDVSVYGEKGLEYYDDIHGAEAKKFENVGVKVGVIKMDENCVTSFMDAPHFFCIKRIYFT